MLTGRDVLMSYSPKVVSAAAGSFAQDAVFNTGRRYGRNCQNACRSFASKRSQLHARNKHGINRFDADMVSRYVALVIGNEGRGVSGRSFMEIADIKVRIPMAGSIESLNAAVAAGILDVSVTNHKIRLRGKTMQAQLNKILEEAKEQL